MSPTDAKSLPMIADATRTNRRKPMLQTKPQTENSFRVPGKIKLKMKKKKKKSAASTSDIDMKGVFIHFFAHLPHIRSSVILFTAKKRMFR
ncbi:hypothetical protein TNCV_168991 [Trichonephila clavipes]|nr:hypothetical protein TNCV_168991 [Trichonephila clavipes]